MTATIRASAGPRRIVDAIVRAALAAAANHTCPEHQTFFDAVLTPQKPVKGPGDSSGSISSKSPRL